MDRAAANINNKFHALFMRVYSFLLAACCARVEADSLIEGSGEEGGCGALMGPGLSAD